MTKHLFVCLFLLLSALSGLAQVNPLPEDLQAQRNAQTDPNGLLYAKACELKDWRTAVVALHSLLINQPDNAFLQDSLAGLYFRLGEWEPCQAWCNQILEKRPQDVYILQIAAKTAQLLGNLPAATLHYEQLYAATKSPYFRYELCTLQYQLGRYGECGSNIESMLSDESLANQTIHMDWGLGNADLPLQAALLNLRGNLELAINKESLARKSFKEALKIAPDFGLARQNLNALQAKQQERFDNQHDR